MHGAKDNDYTAGVICAKVGRYVEREHHADRLLHPLRRTGEKGSGQFAPISWDDALDLVAENFLKAEQKHGAESVWPYYYAGTMGLVMRDGINRLRHAKKYSGFHSTICVNPAYSGFAAGVGRVAGPDPREMAKSDLVVIWGTNAVNTQVNVMTHAVRARKERGAKIAAVDIYMNGTMEQADLPVLVKPGTDAALACAVMHCLFRDGKADWDYLNRYTDAPRELEAHLRTRDPVWASAITGTPVATIEDFARLIGERKRAYFRLGYGFSRSRNGAANMHAASCIAAVTGAWQLEGGGAFHGNADIYKLDKTVIEGLDRHDRSVRMLDQSRIGAILTGDARGAAGRRAGHGDDHPEHQSGVGRARPDLGQARLCARGPVRLRARAVHDRNGEDGRRGAAGHHVPRARRHLSRRRPPIHHPRPQAGRAAGRMPQQSRGDLRLAKRVGAEHPGFAMSPRELIDQMLRVSKRGTLAELEANRWLDCQPPFEKAHYLDGFAWPDGKFRFKPDWPNVPFRSPYQSGPVADMPGLPDHWTVDRAGGRRASVPAGHLAGARLPQFDLQRNADLAGAGKAPERDDPSRRRQGARASATAIMSCWATSAARCACTRGCFDGVRRGVLIAESIWPNSAYADGCGINTLTGADPIAPYGGAAFHDNKVWIRKARCANPRAFPVSSVC